MLGLWFAYATILLGYPYDTHNDIRSSLHPIGIIVKNAILLPLAILVLLVLLTTDYQAFMTMQHPTTSATVGATTDAGLLPIGKASLDYRREKRNWLVYDMK